MAQNPIDLVQLKQLPQIVKNYQLPDPKKATVQMINSFTPFIGLWIAMYLLLDVSIPLVLCLAVVNAFFLVRIFIIQHDCGHQAFLANRKANDIIGAACSFLSFIPYKYWAKSHNFHHGHNGMLWEHRDIGDIDLLTVKEFKDLSRWRKFRYMIYRSFPVMFVIGPIWYILVHNRLPFINLKGWGIARRSLIWNNLFLIGIVALVVNLLGWKALLLVHLPILAFFGIIAVWFFYVQHQHETTYKEWKDKWEFIRAAIQGSTYYKLPKIWHWLTGNIGYHHIHHLNSLVPNYELQRCHHENPIFEKVANSITFTESLKCIYNKLWDEDKQRMISFREYFKRNKNK